MSFNLIRNSRVFFTTNVDSQGRVRAGTFKDGNNPFTANNTFELQVLEGMSFTQNTAQETITLMEAGATPARGQRSFNTSLEPGDFSFSTYMRPFNTGALITCEESCLWNALGASGAATGSITGGTLGTWSITPPALVAGEFLWVRYATASSLTAAATDTIDTAEFSVAQVLSAASGGVNSAVVALYAKNTSNSTPPTAFTGPFTYTFSTGALTGGTLGTWNTTIPTLAAGEFLWVRYAVASSVTAGTTDSIPDTEFSAAAVIAGSAGGVNSALVALYAKNTTSGSAPTAFSGTFTWTFSTGAWTDGPLSSAFTLRNSAVHQLQAFGLIITFDNQTYLLDNCALESAAIDFGIDQIAQIQWAGKFTQFRTSNIAAGVATGGTVEFTGTDVTGTTPDPTDVARAKNTAARYLANKLTTLSLVYSGTPYNLALTGGNVTFANNITYLTPANLGIVNLPITYFTGTRSVTGTLNCYLRSTASSSGPLLTALLANSSTEVDPRADIVLNIGGSTAPTRVTIDIDTAMLQIPTVNTEQVISTQINFTGQGGNALGTAFDITQNNEMSVTYRAAV